MSTKLGATLLIVGSYLMALGIGGINAVAGAGRILFSLVLVVGVVLAGWATLLPWNGARARRTAHDAPGPVPKP